MNTFTAAEINAEIAKLADRRKSLVSFSKVLENIELPTDEVFAQLTEVDAELAIWKNALATA